MVKRRASRRALTAAALCGATALAIGAAGTPAVSASPSADDAATAAGTAAASRSVTLTLPASASTYAVSSRPRAHFHDRHLLEAGHVRSQRRVAYLRFHVRSLPPLASHVRAEVVLTRTTHHLPSRVRVWSLRHTQWSPAQVTWSTRPRLHRSLDTVAANRSTVQVQLRVSGVDDNGDYSFGVTAPTQGVAAFHAADPRLGPLLRITYRLPVAPAPVPPVAPVPVPPVTAVPPVPPSPGGCSVSDILVPSCGVWWGADPGAETSTPKDQALNDFERKIGRNLDIVHSYHTGTQRFPTSDEISQAQQPGANRLLLINWKPELGRTWAQVAAGDPTVDSNIDAEAAYIRAHFPGRFFLAIHHEPEDEVRPQAGSGFTASDYAAMYRHVALRLRADGVSNAIFVMDYMGYYKWGLQPWFRQLYPGDDVVQWLAFDPYTAADNDAEDFSWLMDHNVSSSWSGAYNYLTSLAPGKPIMVAEWGVSNPQDPDRQAWFYDQVGSQITQFPAIKALVYFNAPDAAIDTSPRTLAEYRNLGSLPVFNPTVPSS